MAVDTPTRARTPLINAFAHRCPCFSRGNGHRRTILFVSARHPGLNVKNVPETRPFSSNSEIHTPFRIFPFRKYIRFTRKKKKKKNTNILF